MKHVATVLLVLALCTVGGSAQLAASVWTAGSSDCTSATPLSIFGTSPVDDLKSNLSIASPVAGVPDSGFCPGIAYNLALQFNEKRKFILTSSQGSLSGTAGTPCSSRLVSSAGVKSMGLQLTLPCDATGTVTLRVTSVQADRNTTNTYKQLELQDLPIAPLSACSVSSCAAVASNPAVGNSAATTPATTPMTTTSSTVTGSTTTSSAATIVSNPTVGTSTTVKAPVPDLAKLLKIPKVNFTMNTKPFTFPKIKLNLAIPKPPTNVVVNLALPTIDKSTLASIPTMLESILQQLGAQLKTAAADLGIDIVEDSTASTTTATTTAPTSSLAATTGNNVAQAAVSTGDAVTGAFSNIEAWMKAASAMVSGRRLLSEFENDVVEPLAYPGMEELDVRMARTLTAVNQTVKTDIQRISSFVCLASSDVFAISYTSFKTAGAALLLLIGYLKASATGTIDVDDLSLLDFVSNVAQLGGEMSDLLSRISKLNADAVAPISLSFRVKDIIARLKNNTAVSG